MTDKLTIERIRHSTHRIAIHEARIHLLKFSDRNKTNPHISYIRLTYSSIYLDKTMSFMTTWMRAISARKNIPLYQKIFPLDLNPEGESENVFETEKYCVFVMWDYLKK